jgi:hypothetical protein
VLHGSYGAEIASKNGKRKFYGQAQALELQDIEKMKKQANDKKGELNS